MKYLLILISFFFTIIGATYASEMWYQEVSVTLQQKLMTQDGKVLKEKEVKHTLHAVRLTADCLVVATCLLPEKQTSLKFEGQLLFLTSYPISWQQEKEHLRELFRSDDGQFIYLTTSSEGENLKISSLPTRVPSQGLEVLTTERLPIGSQPQYHHFPTILHTKMQVPYPYYVCAGTPGMPVFNLQKVCLGILIAVPAIIKEQDPKQQERLTPSLILLVPSHKILMEYQSHKKKLSEEDKKQGER